MKTQRLAWALSAVLGLSGMVHAAEVDPATATRVFDSDVLTRASINRFPIRVLPVLVQVSSKGRVTDTSPAYELSPQFDRLLQENLAQMIKGPATDTKGRGIASQFVMNLALDTKARSDGNLDTNFRYVSAQPVPNGRWFWRHVDGYRLELVNRDQFRGPRAYDHYYREPNQGWNGSYPQNGSRQQNTSSPVQRSAPPSAPAPSAATGGRH